MCVHSKTLIATFLQPLDTASARMQTSTFGKSKTLWQTLKDGDWRQAFNGLGASLILTSNPAIQVLSLMMCPWKLQIVLLQLGYKLGLS